MSKIVFILPFRERRRLHMRAYRAQKRDQSEVCGFLIVGNKCRLELWFFPNRAAEPGRWLLHDGDVKTARHLAMEQGKRLLGTFHSHPISEAIPGSADLKGDRVRNYLLIYDVCGLTARLWRITLRSSRRTAVEIPIVCEKKV